MEGAEGRAGESGVRGGERLDEHGYAVAAPAQAAFLRKLLEG